jgi:hypothetical protein
MAVVAMEQSLLLPARDGSLDPQGGELVPGDDALGHGLTVRASDITPYRVA